MEGVSRQTDEPSPHWIIQCGRRLLTLLWIFTKNETEHKKKHLNSPYFAFIPPFSLTSSPSSFVYWVFLLEIQISIHKKTRLTHEFIPPWGHWILSFSDFSLLLLPIYRGFDVPVGEENRKLWLNRSERLTIEITPTQWIYSVSYVIYLLN